MIVKQHDGRRAAERRFAEHVARLDDRRVQRADRHDRGAQDAMLRVEQHDAELLGRPRSEGRQQIRRPRRAGSEAASARSARGDSVRRPSSRAATICARLGATDAGDAREIVARRSRQAVQAAARGEQRRSRPRARRSPDSRCRARARPVRCRRAPRRRARSSFSRGRSSGDRSFIVLHSRKWPHAGAWRAADRPTSVSPDVYCRLMPSVRRLLASVALVVACSFACGGDPPEKEMQQAQGAIDAARAAGADGYAPDEFTAAAGRAEEGARRCRPARLPARAQLRARQPRARAELCARRRPTTKRPRAPTPQRALTAATTAVADARARLRSSKGPAPPAKAHAASTSHD